MTFAGFEVSRAGFVSCQSYHKISNSSRPKLFFGVVNQVASGTNMIAEFLAPLRPLLSTKNYFVWMPDHDQVMNKAKLQLTGTPTLAFLTFASPHNSAQIPVIMA